MFRVVALARPTLARRLLPRSGAQRFVRSEPFARTGTCSLHMSVCMPVGDFSTSPAASSGPISPADVASGKFELVQPSTPYHALNCDGDEVLMTPSFSQTNIPWRLAAALEPNQRRVPRFAFAGAIRPGTDQNAVGDIIADHIERRATVVELVEGTQVAEQRAVCVCMCVDSPAYLQVPISSKY